jgi:hypothetical protein
MEPGLRGLQREVMGPRRPSSSFGLIAVSTLAMVFAVSSSLLLFSAHRHRTTHHHVMVHTRPRPPAVRLRQPAVQPLPPAECKGPVFRPTSEGTTEVVYEQCPPRPFARQ